MGKDFRNEEEGGPGGWGQVGKQSSGKGESNESGGKEKRDGAPGLMWSSLDLSTKLEFPKTGVLPENSGKRLPRLRGSGIGISQLNASPGPREVRGDLERPAGERGRSGIAERGAVGRRCRACSSTS